MAEENQVPEAVPAHHTALAKRVTDVESRLESLRIDKRLKRLEDAAKNEAVVETVFAYPKARKDESVYPAEEHVETVFVPFDSIRSMFTTNKGEIEIIHAGGEMMGTAVEKDVVKPDDLQIIQGRPAAIGAAMISAAKARVAPPSEES